MQFKSEYINDFYNCGWGANGNYDSYINFVQNLDYNPNVMLVGLDLWVFNDAWNEEQIKYPTYQEIKKIDRDKKAIIKESILDCVTRRWNFTDLKKYSNNIGINARVNNNGLAKDGSYYYGKIYRTPDYREKFF
jgi:hypothetical protein